MKFFKRYCFLLMTKEGQKLVRAEERAIKERIWQEDKTRLNLCYAHRQERHQSHYAPHNCHYCQLQEEIGSKKV